MNVTVERLRDLLYPLGTAGDARRFLRVSVDDGSATAVAEPLRSMLAAGDFAQGPYPPRHPPTDPPLPTTVDALTAALNAVVLPPDRLLSLLVNTCTRDLAYKCPLGPWTPGTARPVLAQVITALGRQARWWSNNDFSYAENWDADGVPDCYASDPLTGYVFDRVLIGNGEGVLVTFLAFADD